MHKVSCRYIYIHADDRFIDSSHFHFSPKSSCYIIALCDQSWHLWKPTSDPQNSTWLILNSCYQLLTSKNGRVNTKTQFFRGLAAAWLQPLPKDAADVLAASSQRSGRRAQWREVRLRLGSGRGWEHRGDQLRCWGPGRAGTGDDAGKAGCLLELDIMWRFPKMEVPNGWFRRENPIKMDDDWGSSIYGNPHVWIWTST